MQALVDFTQSGTHTSEALARVTMLACSRSLACLTVGKNIHCSSQLHSHQQSVCANCVIGNPVYPPLTEICPGVDQQDKRQITHLLSEQVQNRVEVCF